MKIWALYSSRVGTYDPHEMIEAFADQETAEIVRANLIGLPVDPRRPRAFDPWPSCWEDDEDFPDLYVRALDLR